MEEDNRTLKERIEALEYLERHENPPKKFRMPGRGKISKTKMKKGYITVVTINDNKSVDFTRDRIIDGTIKLQGGDLSFHAVDPEDVFTYKGKPLIFQPKRKLNPYNPLEGKHETYGQKYIMARMEGDKISLKKSMGWLGWVLGLIVLAVIGYAVISGK